MRRRVLIILSVVGVIALTAVWKLPASAKPTAWLLRDLEAKNGDRAYYARQELAKRREPRAIPVLIRQFDTPDRTAAGYAARAVAAFGEVAVDPLVLALGSPSAHTRSGAAYALGEIGSPRALPRLKEALGDRDEAVRSSAAGALAGIQSPEAAEALAPVISGPDRDLAYVTALRLGRDNGHPAALPGIIHLFDEVQGAARKAELVKGLGKIGTVPAIRFIAERLPTEPSAYVRREMAIAVAASEDPAVAAALDASAAAEQLEVIAGAHAYYLRARPDLDEQLLLAAHRQYGGVSMTEAFRRSGRPTLVQAAAGEAGRPKSIDVK